MVYKLALSLALSASLLSQSVASEAPATDMQALLKEMKAMKEEIGTLNKKLGDSESKIKALETKTVATPTAPAPKAVVVKEAVYTGVTTDRIATVEQKVQKLEEEKQPTKPGYIYVPGANTFFKFGGIIRMDSIYDAGVCSGDVAAQHTLPLQGYDQSASKRNSFRMHGKSTMFSFATVTPTAIGEVGTFIAADFIGNNYYSGTINKNGYVTSSGYTPRLREGYVKIDNPNGQILAGQTWSTFVDLEALGKSVETYNLAAICETRQALLRYTHYMMDKKLSLALGIESSATDYTDATVATAANATAAWPVGTRTGIRYDETVSGSHTYQRLPDVTMMLKFKEDDKFQVALRGVVRTLEVNLPVTPTTTDTSPGYRWKDRHMGYGVGLSSKLFYENVFFNKKTKSSIYAQIAFGKGIGRYLYEGLGQSAMYDSTTRRFSTQMGTGYIVGIEKFWTEQWSTNIGYAHTRIHMPGWFNADSVNLPVSTKMEQFLVNLIYSPIKNLEVGIEYNKYRRFAQGARYYGTSATNVITATTSGGMYQSKEYSGTAHRVQFMVKYVF